METDQGVVENARQEAYASVKEIFDGILESFSRSEQRFRSNEAEIDSSSRDLIASLSSFATNKNEQQEQY